MPVFFGVVALFYMVSLVKEIEIPTVFPINEVNIIGDLKFLDKNEIERIVGNSINGGYFTADLNKARDVLIEQPWLKTVSLRRQWPASLNIFVEEQTPIAFWNRDSYLSDSGDIFKPESVDKKLNLPELYGPDGQHKKVWQFMNVLYKEMALMEYEVVRLNLDNRRAWQLEVNALYGKSSSQFAVKLGRFDTDKRLQRFIHMLPILTAGNGSFKSNIKNIDMRYPNGFAVQLVDNNNSKINISHDFAYQQQLADKQISGA